MTTEEFTLKIENCNSKQSTLILSDFIVKNPEFVTLLLTLMKNFKNPKHWKAAWVLDHVYQKNSELIIPYLDEMVSLFKSSKSDSILRICGKLLSLHDINDKADGNLVNVCFDMLISPEIPVAVKVHAMQLLFNVSQSFEELKPELKLVIEEQIPNNTVGFMSRAKKLLKKL